MDLIARGGARGIDVELWPGAGRAWFHRRRGGGAGMNGLWDRQRRGFSRSGHRRDPLWLAALLHRLSGLALAAFLPIHFLALALALKGEVALDGFLRWTANPLVKVAEMGLVFFLSLHVLGGIRILLVENLPAFGGQKQLAAAALVVASLAALVFLVRAA